MNVRSIKVKKLKIAFKRLRTKDSFFELGLVNTCTDDGGLGVAAEAVLQDPGELAVSVGDVGGDAAAQLLDDLITA